VVKNITDYGAFVDLGGIDGLLHVTDIAWRRVNHPTEVLNIGQTVKVQIIKINHDTHRISLGMKQLQTIRGQGIEAKYPVGARFKGRVTNITDYGAFVELEPGIEGLIHVSEMSWTKKNVHPGKIVSTSQEVDVQVLEVDPVKRRISLGLKQTRTIRGKPSPRSTRSVRRRGRGQEQDRIRSVHRPRRRCRRHGPSLRPRLEPPGEQVIEEFKKGDMVKAKSCSTSMSRRSASRSASSSSRSRPRRAARRALPARSEVRCDGHRLRSQQEAQLLGQGSADRRRKAGGGAVRLVRQRRVAWRYSWRSAEGQERSLRPAIYDRESRCDQIAAGFC
jgi:small subunit ribosomal protein S1